MSDEARDDATVEAQEQAMNDDAGLIDEHDVEHLEAEEAVTRGNQEPERHEDDDRDRTDWKAQAIEAKTRLQMLEEQRATRAGQGQQAERQVDDVTRLRSTIQEKQANLPKLEEGNAESFWNHMRAKDEIVELKDQLTEARLRQQERVLAEQRTDALVRQYASQFADRPQFKAIRKEFDGMVQRLEPHLRGNSQMLDMLRRNLEHKHMESNQGRRAAPPAAPDGAHNRQAAPRNQKQATWRSDDDRAVGEYYVSRGIISGPDEFYASKFNENSESANNNGVAIYDVPESRRGWKR